MAGARGRHADLGKGDKMGHRDLPTPPVCLSSLRLAEGRGVN